MPIERLTPLSLARQAGRFLIHVVMVYGLASYSVPWLSGFLQGRLLPLLGSPTSLSVFEFLFTHLFALSLASGLLTGLVAGQFRHRVASFAWIVPAVVLMYKLLTFPTSVLEGHSFASAVQYYVGGGFSIPEYHSWSELAAIARGSADMARGLDQLRFSAPLYVGIAYGVGVWISMRARLSERMKAWMDRRGDRTDS